MQIKKSVMIVALAALLIMPLASAGFFDFITGKATNANTNLNITVANTAPNITLVNVSTFLGDYPESSKLYTFAVYVYDHDGDRDVNGTLGPVAVNVNFTKGGETSRYASCAFANNLGDAKTAVYSCNVTFWYYDARGNWNASASANDSSGAMAYNLTQILTVPVIWDFKMTPDLITWSNLVPGSDNASATEHSLLNNTGNIVYSVGGNLIQMNATNLSGGTNPIQIGADLFAVGNETDSCGFNKESENSFVNVTSYLGKGNLSDNPAVAQEDLYYCLTHVPEELEKQPYGTLHAWTIKTVDKGF